MKFSKVILITGGAGFIGTHLVKHWVKKYPDQLVINLDLLTYAGNLENLIDIEESTSRSQYTRAKSMLEGVLVKKKIINDPIAKKTFFGISRVAK
jgi:dTDP-D-glucose 4,6-dehydratase